MIASKRLLVLAFVALAATAAGAVTTAEQEANCLEAARRYEELYAKQAATESPPVLLMFKHTFCPAQLAVPQGTSVRFLNIDKRTSHSFWFRDAGRPESERFMPGEGTTMVMDLAVGTHTYLCGPHWEHEGMVGTVTILPP